MKYRNNPLLEEMLGSPVANPRRDKNLIVRLSEEEHQQYKELSDMDIDLPYMIREFIVKLHKKVKEDA